MTNPNQKPTVEREKTMTTKTQNAPQSSSADVVLIAWRDTGGFWSAARLFRDNYLHREPEGVVFMRGALIEDWESIFANAQMHDDHYLSVNGRDVSVAEAAEVLGVAVPVTV